MSVIAVVPARGGSKGLPGKNLADLGGRTLVAHAVLAAAACAGIDEVVVSSDDPAILDEARSVGATAHERPADLSTDEATTFDVVVDVLAARPEADAVVVLQPTSPLRTAADVAACLRALGDAGSVVTVAPQDHPWQWTVTVAGSEVAPVAGWDAFGTRRQDLPPAYRLNGAVYAVRRDWLEAAGSLVGPGTVAVVMPTERSLDIDTAADLDRARALWPGTPAPGQYGDAG